MTVYKRSIFGLIKGIIGGICAGLLVGLVVSFFTEDYRLVFIVGVAVTALILFISIFSENIKFELDGNKLKYYKRGKLKEEFNLEETNVRYHVRTTYDSTGGDSTMYVYFTRPNEDEMSIDFSPLGLRRFENLMSDMDQFLNLEPIKLETKKKEKK